MWKTIRKGLNMDSEMFLKGVRVLELGHTVAGPFCAMLLSDLGADVIKIEEPGTGDFGRGQYPVVDGQSAVYLSMNRNKKSVALNLKSTEGREILYKIAETSDVVVTNFRSDAVEKLGADYEALKKLNPEIIYCSISGFGEGPYSDRPAYDPVLQGMGGYMGITGEEGRPPVRVGVAVVDLSTGMYAALAILGALVGKTKTGKGQNIEVTLFDAAAAWMSYAAHYYFITGKQPPKMGSGHFAVVPYQCFETKDGKYVTVCCGNETTWKRLCSALDRKELADHPNFSSNVKRVENRNKLVPMLEQIFLSKTRDEWLQILLKADVPCGPVYDMKELFSDPQIIHRNMLVEISHPTLGRVKQIMSPMKFSNVEFSVIHPPTLGEHTVEILREIGYSDNTVKELRNKGVI